MQVPPPPRNFHFLNTRVTPPLRNFHKFYVHPPHPLEKIVLARKCVRTEVKEKEKSMVVVALFNTSGSVLVLVHETIDENNFFKH